MASYVQDSIDNVLQSACVDGARYHTGDSIGLLLAHFSLTPYLVLFYQAAITFNHRSLHAVAGRLLKRAIRQDRPLSTCEALGICNKPGMPSSHAQITFYALTVFLLQLLRSQRFSKLSFLQCSKGFAYLAASLLVACSRVYLGYHTVAQVIAGAAAGSTMAFLWLAITRCAAPRFRGWQTSRLGQVFRLKDTWYLPDVLLFEYDNVLKAQHTKKTH